jgi:hypothetical protein
MQEFFCSRINFFVKDGGARQLETADPSVAVPRASRSNAVLTISVAPLRRSSG